MADSNLNEFNIADNMYSSNTIDFSSMFTGSLIGAGSASTETLELSSTPDINKHNSFVTLKKIYDFQYKLSSSDSWTTGFNSNDSVVLNKYVDLYKEKTGIDLYDLSNYSFDELVEMGVFQQNGDFIPDREMVEQIMKDNNFNNYFESGYGVDVFCSWVRDNASIEFDNNTTIMNTKFCDLKSLADNNGYVKSDDENNVLATAESDSLIQTTNQIYAQMTPEYVEVLNEYLKTKPISEVIGEDGKMHINENDFKQFVLKHNSEDPEHQFFGDDEYSITKQTHALVLGVNNLDIKYNSIKEDRHKDGTFGELFNEEKKFSDASDHDQVDLNIFNNDLTNGVKEKFGRDSNMYKVYCKFLEEKTLNDIIVDNHFVCSQEDLKAAADAAGVSLSEREINTMLQYFSETSVTQYSDSATLRNLKIQKIISNPSGYDSIIFEKDDEVIIGNTCADGESPEDSAAIAYSAIKLLCGDNDELYNLLSSAFKNQKGSVAGLMSYNDISKARDYYKGQIENSYSTVMEQLQSGKKVHINCYSLGGGTGFDTFMRIMSDDNIPEEYKSRLSISGFNPFFNIFEADTFFDDKGGHEAVIKKVFDKYGDQIDLRCIEGDVVSQFNTVIDGELGKHITYIKPSDNSPAELSAFDNDIMKLIVDPSSRHSLGSMNENSFFNGYLLENGQRMTLNEILGNDEPSNDLSVIYKGLVTPYLEDLKNQEGNSEFTGIIDALDEYLYKHIGENIDYDDMIEALAPEIAKLTEAKVPDAIGNYLKDETTDISDLSFDNPQERTWSFLRLGWYIISKPAGQAAGVLLNHINDEDKLAEFITNYYTSDDGKESMKEIIQLISSGNANDVEKLLIKKIASLYFASVIHSL